MYARFSALPLAIDTETAQDYLRSYVETYLTQEVQAEALTRNVGTFARFLEVAARQNAQTTNATGTSRDTGVHRRTVESHFQILVDTLLGPQMETLILNEVRAYLGYSKLGYVPHYWRSYDGAEVDILIETARGVLSPLAPPPQLGHFTKERDHVRCGQAWVVLTVEAVHIDSQTLGVAPVGVFSECDVLGRLAS